MVASTRYRGMNALHAAGGLGAGKLCVYRYLLDVVKMDVTEPDTTPSKRTPLEHAVEGGNLLAVRFILDHGADFHQDRERNISILHIAATKGDEAFEQQDYTNASVFYTQVLKVDPSDAKMFAKRSLCWLRLGDGQKALGDAIRGVNKRSKCAEAHLWQGEALMFLKEYEKACKVLSCGLELDHENDEMDKLFWEAMELKQK